MLTGVFEHLARDLRPGTAGVCVSLLGSRDGTELPDTALLTALSSVRSVVAANSCPKTYASMVVVVDSQGRPVEPQAPSGYVDPTSLTFGRPQFDRTDHAYIYVRETRGMSGRDFLCTAGGDQGRVVQCRQVSRWVH